MSRILVLVPFALEEKDIAKRREQTAEVALGSDVIFEYKPVAAGPSSFMSPHDWALMDIALFEAGLSAQEDGYDAVVIDTVSGSGADALRSMLDIPVLAPGRASLLFALSLGRKFGILAQWEPAMTRYRKVIDEWGFGAHCAGVEHFDTPPDFAALIGDKADTTLPKMEAACGRLIERGADVICLGSTTMHHAHHHLTEVLEVPVVNPGPLSYKLMESFLALGLTHSRRAYPKPQVAKADMIHAMQAAAAAQQSAGSAVDRIGDARDTVETFLRLVEDRRLDEAAGYLAEDVTITFPGGRQFSNLAEQVASSGGRFRSVRKVFERFDAVADGELVVVYALGTLQGEALDGSHFSGVRFVDRFELRDGSIVDQKVWNDMAEHKIVGGR